MGGIMSKDYKYKFSIIIPVYDVEDPKKTARNMVYVLEGLKLLNRTGDISEKMIDDEFVFLLQGILPAK